MQGARIIHSRQRQENFMADNPNNVYTINMGQSVKMSPDRAIQRFPSQITTKTKRKEATPLSLL